MKIVVDRELCEANGRCVAVAPELFRLDAQDRLELLVEEPAGEALEKARLAVRRCPRAALKLVG